MTAQPTIGRIKGFDGLRAVALGAVFLQHYTTLGAELELGSYGVWLFFALSGFLIVRILHRERLAIEAGAGTVREALGRFFWRRTLRIMPPYYLVLAIFTVLGLLGLAQDLRFPDAWWFYGYLSNHYFGEVVGEWTGRFSAYWSLAVEEQFYLLAAPILLLTPARAFRKVCAAAVLVALARDLYLRLEGVEAIAVYTSAFVNFGALAFGGWLALALPARPRDGERSSPALAALAGIAGVCLVFWRIGAFPKAEADLIAAVPLIATTVFAAGALALVYLNQASALVRVLEWRPLAYVGRISYGLYLVHNLPPHWLLTGAARRLGYAWSAPEALEAAFSFGLALVLATLSWRLVEQPLMQLKDWPRNLAAWVERLRGPFRTARA